MKISKVISWMVCDSACDCRPVWTTSFKVIGYEVRSKIFKLCKFLSIWKTDYQLESLAHFMPLISFYTPWKNQKTKGFLIFSRGIERDRGMKWVKNRRDIFTIFSLTLLFMISDYLSYIEFIFWKVVNFYERERSK